MIEVLRRWPARVNWALAVPVAIGLLLMYAPLYRELLAGPWQTDDQAHGPFIVLISVWLLARVVAQGPLPTGAARPWSGNAVFGFGLLLYVVCKSQDILFLALFSQFFVAAGLALVLGGWPCLRVLAFPLFFLLFSAPLPGALVDALTGPLKHFISGIAEQVLYAAGLPVTRSGVILYVGPYQLLVADACAGLHSLFSLSALTCLYLYLQQYASRWRNALLLALAIPVAIAANLIRVLLLVLITYYLGDAAGQGFMHGLAGMVMFGSALLLIFAADGVLGRLWRKREART
ncbi:exosortase B [Jeongeupia naejangsanensis]|uniref:Exosortase B n=1 Tax=Jeongeupia naejangsanensis TaxID=613195 RepID=A0ABS2BI37_9NEIS|nr:exosortase B [Jeongeupia naejangsanensis]MBM3115145.1 exosortase B [Jeongeupia naejangsanensis]